MMKLAMLFLLAPALWAQTHLKCIGDGITDDTQCWSTALATAAAHDGQLLCPRGIYKVGSLKVPSNVHISGPGRSDYTYPGRCELKASGSGPILILTGSRFVTIEHLTINGASLATAGIFDGGSVITQILGNYFVGFANGSAALRGGGTLYADIKDNTFSVDGYAMDYQNSYSSAPSLTYYGINVGEISGNKIYARNGVRLSGTLNFERNDIEIFLDSPALASVLPLLTAASMTAILIFGIQFSGLRVLSTTRTSRVPPLATRVAQSMTSMVTARTLRASSLATDIFLAGNIKAWLPRRR